MQIAEKILIYGAPGAGKTTYGKKLEKELGYPLLEADYLREVVAQKEKTREEDPFVYVGTKEAYRHFGALNDENVIKGLKAVRKSMAPYVEREVAKFSNSFIMEGAFLDPENLKNLGRLILVVTSDEPKHRSQYFQHREQNEDHIESFEAARIIQSYLIKESKNYVVEILET